MKMTRQQQRRIHKLTGKELKQLEMDSIAKGVQLTLTVVYKVMNEEFGFGDKRLDRLEDAVLRKIEEMGESE